MSSGKVNMHFKHSGLRFLLYLLKKKKIKRILKVYVCVLSFLLGILF